MSTDFQWHLDDREMRELIQNTPDKLDAWLREVATEILGDIVESFGTSPSVPGDPPGVDTGALRASMKVEQDGDLRYLLMDGVEYGVHLELGTEKMEARPFITPKFEEWQDKLGESARDEGLLDG